MGLVLILVDHWLDD
ncbi:hypothetical protein NG742_13485 (plasmid) [Carnobacterium divergens]|nr:hypothetical protein [Carnobacterium divergens]